MDRIYTVRDIDIERVIHKYNYEDLVQGKGLSTHYFIPPEIVIEDYETDKVGIFTELFTYPNGEISNWICKRSFARILEETCNISVQEYYDLFILQILNKSQRPYCENCGGPLGFFGNIYMGYSNNGYPFDPDTVHFCCKECYHEYRAAHPEDYVESMAKTAYTQFINHGDPNDPIQFYIASTFEEEFKYGITQDINKRNKIFENVPYKNYKILGVSTRLRMAKLEYDIKIYLNDFHEHLDPSRISDFRRAFNKAITSKTNPSDKL